MNSSKRVEIGSRLRTARILARLSQEEAAVHLRVSQQAIGSWEAGRTLPSLEWVYEICVLYGVAPGYVVLAQGAPVTRKFDFCPAEGRDLCKALGSDAHSVVEQRAA